ncbi:MAG TPA: ABC transporter substrate-binding protein [Candidatus Limnocylindria bacterium]|nr:ABC transporter substrate-binding protein [Candidatus Limnocylindria bacterium]
MTKCSYAVALLVVMVVMAACAPASAPSSASAAATPTPGPTIVLEAGKPPRYTGPKTTMKVVVQGRPDQAPFELAFRRGYFDSLGITVDPITIPTGAEALQAIATNQVQAGPTSPSAALFNALNRGVDLRIVADQAHIEGATDTTVSILVRSALQGQVKSMADLKGKKFAIGGAPGSIGDLIAAKAAAKDGIKLSDMTVNYLPLGDILGALASGAVDAGMLVEPLVGAAVGQKIAFVLYPGGQLIDGTHVAVIVYSPQFAAQTEVATRFMIGYLLGVRDFDDAFFQNKGKTEAIDLLVQYLALKDKNVWANARQPKGDLNGKVNVPDLKAQADFFASLKLIEGAVPDVTKYVDTRFTEGALKIIGSR